jgi:hypothetical protein
MTNQESQPLLKDEAARTRLAELDRALARLREKYDLIMSEFKFDEARRVFDRIAAAEAERESLAEFAPSPSSPPQPTVIPGPSQTRHARRLRGVR